MRTPDFPLARSLACAIACALASAAWLPGAASAGDDTSGGQPGLQYHVEKLPSLGGSSSLGASLNNHGWVAGRSDLDGGVFRHAALWRDGRLVDLGTLGGPDANSAVLWPVKNVRGLVVGVTQTAEPDPHNETWSCGYFFPNNPMRKGRRCVGFAWQDGVMRPLDTLGGTHGYATGANNRGQIVGWAETNVEDPTCNGDQKFEFLAVVWSSDGKVLRELPPWPGDSATAATAINDRGQVVGISGECDIAFGQRTAIRAVLWDGDEMIELGDIGGDAWNTPTAINPQGDIVGFLNQQPGNGFVPMAFLWTREGGLQPLGTMTQGGTSQASGINAARHVVGRDCSAAGGCNAFLWRDGVMHDLQDLVTSGDELDLRGAGDIDDLGRITGQAFDPATGTFVAYLATPKRK